MENADLQKNDFDWFNEQKKNLFKKYGYCFLAIKNKTILGAYKTFADAVLETKKTEEMGTFIVQECTDAEDDNTNYIMTVGLCVI